ncbi:MAG: MFS transporter, partial [Solirubrobacteraceae bacterium]
GLAANLPHTLTAGLRAHGVPLAKAAAIGHIPAVSVLFSAFLGYNPARSLLGAGVLSHLNAHNAAVLTGRSFFPALIAGPFRDGLHTAFVFAIVACLIAAVTSAMRGGVYHHGGQVQAADGLVGAGERHPGAPADLELDATPAGRA